MNQVAFQSEIQIENHSIIFKIRNHIGYLSFKDVIHLWINQYDFRKFYTDVLIKCNFEAFCWEHPPITFGTLDRDYEFKLIESKSLAKIKKADLSFQEHFTEEEVVSFDNLGANARLIVPCPKMDNENYIHLAKFISSANESQIQALWEKTGLELQLQINEKPKWLSTAGLGVHWLHVRIDTRPKYYKDIVYKNPAYFEINK